MSATRVVRFFVKPAVFAAALVPLGLLVRAALSNGLGANPIEAVTHTTGDWTLRFLLMTLAVTPLRWITGWNPAVRFRRMLGLFAFFYGMLHLLTYVVLDKFFAWHEILRDVMHRRFIMVGATALALLVPLAATSTAGMIRRMGGRAWQALHRLVYLSAIAGVVHYWWLVKADVTKPRVYAVVLGTLFGVRLIVAWRRRRQTTARPRSHASIAASRQSPEAATGR
jgi:sulfoxide reductase heme-binding subunit YedZ